MSVLENLLREVLRSGDHSGVTYVRKTHVPEETFASLAYLTHDHAFAVGTEGSSDGERIYDGGIYPWWRDEGGLSEEEAVRLYMLRSDVVSWLKDQGLASRSSPRSTPLRVMTREGDRTRPDLGGVDETSGWAFAEIQPTVAAYFTMLRAELAGQRYVKAAVNRQVQAATGRSRGAVEFKFANISAVLRDMGLPYVLGYQPRGNYQGALRAEVERSLARDPEIPGLLEDMPTPDVPPTAQLEEAKPPVMAPSSTSGRSRIAVDVDFLERHARNRDVGLKGELLVVEHERRWLSDRGRPDLAERVAHVPSTLGDGAGYDVSSFQLDGSPHHIEVKATPGSIAAPFFLSAGELRYAVEPQGAYSIYRVFDLGPNPKFYRITGDMAEILELTPVSYRALVRAPGARSTTQDQGEP